ncbi:hypothetical protein BY458DRAFT_511827 [Sporodiniella umbellata]|nr:hypothetical protein BY458DRAFT_511827 [Sporodiniella umbellata]
MSTTVATLQNNSISLHGIDDENIALSNYLAHPYQKHETWIQSKQNYVTHNNHRKQRRSSPLPQTASSVDIPSNNRQKIPTNSHLRNQLSNSERRKSALAGTLVLDRPPSTTSSVSSSITSIQSGLDSKTSFSKKLRKVFSMTNIRSSRDINSLQERNGSIISLSSSISSTLSVESNKKPSLRRRSIASLASLFQRSSIQEEQVCEVTIKQDNKKKPELRVDTSRKQRKSGTKGRSNYSNSSNITPDSPNSAISSRSSLSRIPPPVVTNQRFVYTESLPSPTPSSSSSSSSQKQDEMLKMPPNRVGIHYGMGLHSSPKLRPAPAASSSSSSLTCLGGEKRRVKFCAAVQVHETFSASDYDRRCDANATCQKVTPMLVMKIKQELNEYKLTEMDVHVESRQYTQFYL